MLFRFIKLLSVAHVTDNSRARESLLRPKIRLRLIKAALRSSNGLLKWL